MISILAGYPSSTDEWLKLQEQASCALEDARHDAGFSKADGTHHQGNFQTLRCGISHGGSQKKPGNLRNEGVNKEIVERLNGLEPFQRLASFTTCT